MKSVCVVVMLLLVGCSGTSSSQADCEAIAQNIRNAAIKRGYDGNHDGTPDATGICTDADAAIVKDFGQACADLRSCNASVSP